MAEVIPKNVLVREGRLILLDHEVVHYGDPAFDIGFALTHFLSKAHHLSHMTLQLGEAAHTFVAQYLEGVRETPWASGAESRAVRHTLGCLLARVAASSPLEYLTDSERRKQSAVVLELMGQPRNVCPSLFLPS